MNDTITATTPESSVEPSSQGHEVFRSEPTPAARPQEPQTPQEPQQSQEPQQVQQPAPQSTHPTAEDIARAMLQMQQQQGQPPQQQQQPEYTEEQFNREFGVVTIDKPLMDSLFGMDSTPEQLEGMNMLVKNIVAMALKMSDFRTRNFVQEQLGSVTEKLSPLETAYQEHQNNQFTNKFYNQHPELKNYDSIVKTVVSNMTASGQKFNSAEEAMSAIASQTTAMLKQAGIPIGQQVQQPSGQTTQAPHSRQRPAAVSTGGGAGTNTSASPAQRESRGLSVFR